MIFSLFEGLLSNETLQNDFYKLLYDNRLTKKQEVVCYEHNLITILRS